MPTLINYNQATFKNHVKPNKGRLQELQHSAARAHAARVPYWRKKGVSLPDTPSPERRRSEEGDSSISPSTHVPKVKKDSDKADESLSIRKQHKLRWKFESTHDSQHVEQSGDPSTLLKLIRSPATDLFDPFDSTPARQDTEVVAAVDHYLHNWAPSQRPGLKYQTKDNPLIRDAFPAALQNVELFEAIVALCLSFKAAGQNFQTQMSNWSLYHKGQALSGIRNKLKSGCVDEAVILATVFLMIIDNVFLDVHAYETHLYGLRKMARAFKAASSKELFGGSLLSFIAWADSNALLLFGSRVASQKNPTNGTHLEYPIQPFPSTVMIVVGTLTPGFQSVALDGQLSVEVLSILAKTIHWINCIDPKPGQSPSGTDQAFLISLDPRASSAELMSLCRVAGEEHVVEQAICKAVYIFHANLLGWTCRCSGYRRVVEEVGVALREFQELWDRDLWTWLALITANAARRGTMQHLQTEVASSLLFSEQSVQDWEGLQAITKRFLFHSKMGQEWKLCWDLAKTAAADHTARSS